MTLLERTEEARDKVGNAVDENFGYCPDYEWFDLLMVEMTNLESELKKADPKAWATYERKWY